MSRFNLLLFIAFLSSSLCFAQGATKHSRMLVFGLANIQTVSVVSNSETHMYPFVVVRVTSRKGDIASYGISNEAGILGMPLPPGEYCYEAFSRSGLILQMTRRRRERCFNVRAGETTTIGVSFKADSHGTKD